MRVTSVEATAPNGKTYQMTRLGRIIGTGGFGAYGIYQSYKSLTNDEYVKELTEAAKEATKNKLHTFTKTRKVLYGASAAAITALCGFLFGGVVDFCINKHSRNKAMKEDSKN